MRYAPEHNEGTREGILGAASRLFREHGIAAVGLTKIMTETDLTVATFYTHFKSKEALVSFPWFRGHPYASFDYQKLLEQHGIRCSMSRRGNCLDNAPVESFFGTLKNEHVHHCDFESIEAARAGVIDYIETFYNPRRRHSALGYRTPIEYEAETRRSAAS